VSDSPRLLRVELSQPGPIPLDVSFECGAGEVLALVGPSGGGKTTVLRSIAGLYKPQHGRVTCGEATWLDTESSTVVTPQQRQCGLVFQSFALFPHMTALDNVAVAVQRKGRAERRDAAREFMARVNMSGLEARRPAELSGGQRQRVALARALARSPSVLLLDEPFSSVDQITRRRLQHELAQLKEELAMPVILVTHDLDEAQLLGDRISVLHRGRTLQSGPTKKVMRAPINAEVAHLLDQQNVFDGRVVEHDVSAERSWIAWGHHRLECRLIEHIDVGAEVHWLIPRAYVVLHRRDRPSRGENENPVHGVIGKATALGDDVWLSVDVPGATRPLNLTVSIHVAERNSLKLGADVGLSILSAGIHVMAKPG
jgi:molybdate transport system ATP-binding protein